jgi:hypothetical protein
MRARPLAFVFLSIFAFVANAQAQSAPSISSLSQPLGPGNTPITITGASFGATQGASFVAFGSTVAPPSSWSDTSIVVPVPNSLAAGDLNITVTVGGVSSNSALFTVIPVIYQLSTYSASAGTQVTITGVGFSGTQAASTITFNGLSAAASSWSNSSIVTAVPIGASTGPLVVTVNSLGTNSVNFTVPTPTPTVASLSPGLGPIGTLVTVIGTNFGDTQGSSRVLFPGLQGSPASFPTSWSATSISVPVPTGAVSGRVSVMVNGRVSNSLRYIVATLNISGVSPTSGGPGTTVTITGSGFGSTQTTSLVTFNGIPATVSAWSDTQIVAIVPNNATSGNVFVVENNTPSNGFTFTVATPTPVISTIAPATGGIGTSVTITGSNFGNTQGQSIVTFNGISARISSWSNTSVVAKAPTGLVPGPATLIVAVSQAPSNGVQYTVTQPLFVTPNQATLTVGDTRSMQLIDENGVLINNSTWTFDDPSIAEIIAPQNPGDPTLLQGDTVGTTNFIASYGNRTGTAKITVLPAGAPLPIGAVQWSVPPLGSFGISKSVQSVRIDESTPDLYVEDDGSYGGNGSIRALTADGQQKWIWPNTLQDKFPLLVAADNQGGVVYFASQDNPGPFSSFCYFGHVDQSGTETWQYQESNCREDYAIAPDGTIFLVEDVYQNTDSTVITALDPATGQVKFTVPLPAASRATFDVNGAFLDQYDPYTLYCSPGSPGFTTVEGRSVHGSISITSDGNAYIPFTTNTSFGDAEPCDSSPLLPFRPELPHPVRLDFDGTWSASNSLNLMIIHPDGSSSSQQLDSSFASGTGLTAAGAPGFFGMGRAISDGQGGALFTLSFPSALYHVSSGGSSKFGLPITPDAPPGDDLFLADSMLLGEDGTAYITGSSTPQAPVDTVLAVDSNSGNVKWTASPGVHPKLSTVASDGSLAFQYSLPDFSVHSAFADPTGNISPLFPNPDDSDAGPVIFESFGLHLPSYWILGTWHNYLPDSSIAAIVGLTVNAASYSYAYFHGSQKAQNKPKIPIIHTFVPDPYLVDPNTNQVDPQSPKKLTDFLKAQFGGKAEVLGFPLSISTYPKFQDDIQKPSDAFGFIGHSFELGVPATSVGLCFYIQDSANPLYKHDCIIQHDFIGQFDQAANPAIKPEDVAKLHTQPKVIFIAACATQDAFKKLWDIDTTTRGRALIIPQTNLANSVDLLWGATAWTAIVDSLLQGKSVADAVRDGNAAASSRSSQYTWQVIGDSNVKLAKRSN